MFRMMFLLPCASSERSSSRRMPVFSPRVIFPLRSTIATSPAFLTFAVSAIEKLLAFCYRAFILTYYVHRGTSAIVLVGTAPAPPLPSYTKSDEAGYRLRHQSYRHRRGRSRKLSSRQLRIRGRHFSRLVSLPGCA